MTQDNKGTEGSAPAIDLTKYVPKDEVEKAQATLKAEKDKVASELEQAKMSLLDPEYIAYLEDKKAKMAKDKQATLPDTGDVDVNTLTPTQLLNLATQKAVELVESRLDGRLRKSEDTLGSILAVMELQECEKKYDDFGDYRDKVAKILDETKSQLTIEQAYKIAKSENPDINEGKEKSPEPKGKRPTSEKPTGSHPAESFQPKQFKDKTAAALDAWDQVVGAGKDTL